MGRAAMLRVMVALALLVGAAFITVDEVEAVTFAFQPATKSFNCDSVTAGTSPFDVADDACLLRTSPTPYRVTSKGAVDCAVRHLDRSKWDTACEDRDKAAVDLGESVTGPPSGLVRMLVSAHKTPHPKRARGKLRMGVAMMRASLDYSTRLKKWMEKQGDEPRRDGAMMKRLIAALKPE